MIKHKHKIVPIVLISNGVVESKRKREAGFLGDMPFRISPRNITRFYRQADAKFVGNKRRASVGRAELQVYNLKTKHPQLIGREIYWFIHSVCNGFGGNENLFYPKGNAAIPSQEKVGHQLLRINRQKYLEIL